MSSDALWNYGVLVVVALVCLGLVVRFFRRELSGKGGSACGCCSGSCEVGKDTVQTGKPDGRPTKAPS